MLRLILKYIGTMEQDTSNEQKYSYRHAVIAIQSS